MAASTQILFGIAAGAVTFVGLLALLVLFAPGIFRDRCTCEQYQPATFAPPPVAPAEQPSPPRRPRPSPHPVAQRPRAVHGRHHVQAGARR